MFKCVSMGRHNLDSKLLRNTIISPWKYFLTKLRLEDDVIMLQRAATQAPLALVLKKFFSWFQTCLLRSRAPSKRGQGPLLTLWGHFSPPGESELCNIFKFNFLLKEDSEFLLKVELIRLLDGTNKVERWDRESLDQFFTLFLPLS